jgi:hypothetical protein
MGSNPCGPSMRCIESSTKHGINCHTLLIRMLECKKIYAKKVTETCLDQWDCEMGLECKGDKCSAVEYTANSTFRFMTSLFVMFKMTRVTFSTLLTCYFVAACADCSSKGGQCLCDPHQGDNICVPNNAFAPEVYFNQKTRDSCNSGYQVRFKTVDETFYSFFDVFLRLDIDAVHDREQMSRAVNVAGVMRDEELWLLGALLQRLFGHILLPPC